MEQSISLQIGKYFIEWKKTKYVSYLELSIQ